MIGATTEITWSAPSSLNNRTIYVIAYFNAINLNPSFYSLRLIFEKIVYFFMAVSIIHSPAQRTEHFKKMGYFSIYRYGYIDKYRHKVSIIIDISNYYFNVFISYFLNNSFITSHHTHNSLNKLKTWNII